ncbi:MAG: hypothetical protein MRERV_45c010 [Mycoplasmataceae bacterium RV_VA103A]|nr:MAG: hypothetical protein MRERV_45c010 [Mycoplasmataceae bacterium RV_VA103A]
MSVKAKNRHFGKKKINNLRRVIRKKKLKKNINDPS